MTEVVDSGQDCARLGIGGPYRPVVVGLSAPPPACRLIVGHFAASWAIIVDGPGSGTMFPLGQHLGGHRCSAPATGPVSWVALATPLSPPPDACNVVGVVGVVVVGVVVGIVGAVVGVVLIIIAQSIVLVT